MKKGRGAIDEKVLECREGEGKRREEAVTGLNRAAFHISSCSYTKSGKQFFRNNNLSFSNTAR